MHEPQYNQSSTLCMYYFAIVIVKKKNNDENKKDFSDDRSESLQKTNITGNLNPKH
ncbi:130_t:CDS:2 [Entrophospora sp. SA101]|nr:130_t:CDS:2 [Entrophospora sp. SA101]